MEVVVVGGRGLAGRHRDEATTGLAYARPTVMKFLDKGVPPYFKTGVARMKCNNRNRRPPHLQWSRLRRVLIAFYRKVGVGNKHKTLEQSRC